MRPYSGQQKSHSADDSFPTFRGTVLTRDSLRDLTVYFKLISRYRHAWILAGVCVLGSVGLRLPMPLLTGYIIDKVLVAKHERQLDEIAASLVAITLLYIFLSYISEYIFFRIRKSAGVRVSLQLLRTLEAAPLSYLSRFQTGYLVNRVLLDPAPINNIAMELLNVATNIVMLLVGIVSIFAINIRLATISMALLPLFVLSFFVFQKKISTYDSEIKEQNAVLGGVLGEALSGITTSKLYQLGSAEARKFLRALQTELRLSLRSFNYEYACSAFSNFVGAMGPLAVLWFGGREIMSGRMTVGQLVAFSALLSFLYGPTKGIYASHFNLLTESRII